jgi:hypothetical protein
VNLATTGWGVAAPTLERLTSQLFDTVATGAGVKLPPVPKQPWVMAAPAFEEWFVVYVMLVVEVDTTRYPVLG